jgi:hypothetical protein
MPQQVSGISKIQETTASRPWWRVGFWAYIAIDSTELMISGPEEHWNHGKQLHWIQRS